MIRSAAAFLALEHPHHKLLYVVLSLHADQDGRCDPTIATLSEESGLSRRAVIRSMISLLEVGVVTVERSLGRKSIYHLNGQIAHHPPVPQRHQCPIGTSAPQAPVPHRHQTSAPQAPDQCPTGTPPKVGINRTQKQDPDSIPRPRARTRGASQTERPAPLPAKRKRRQALNPALRRGGVGAKDRALLGAWREAYHAAAKSRYSLTPKDERNLPVMRAALDASAVSYDDFSQWCHSERPPPRLRLWDGVPVRSISAWTAKLNDAVPLFLRDNVPPDPTGGYPVVAEEWPQDEETNHDP